MKTLIPTTAHVSTLIVRPKLKEALTEIAKQHLDRETLETRNLDRLDFMDHSAEGIRRALLAAFILGQREMAAKMNPKA